MGDSQELERFHLDMGKVKDHEDKIVDDESLTDSSVSDKHRPNERGTWGNKAEFFLAIIGYTIGVGSVWRFPVICSRNGGGAFLIPFFFFLATCGGPLYYLEVCLGQFTGKSAGLSFEFCPLLQGLGLLQVILSTTVLWYAMAIFAWVLYFLYSSFLSELPWTTCAGTWNTDKCIEISELWKATNTSDLGNTTGSAYSSSAYEFLQYKVLGRSSGLEELGSLQPHLVVCLFLSWLLVVLAVIKGVQSLGKVVYVTATLPYLLLTVMFVRGLTLDGAVDGMRFFITPNFSKLLEVQVWLEAAIQVFYSLGPSWGGVITMASYNRFHQKSFWCSTACVMSSGFTSFYNGLVVFTIIGFMAKEAGVPVEELAKQSGTGLAFIVFPTAISRMPVPHLWAVLFFLTLVAVVFDSLFGMFETVTSGVIDLFPRHLLNKRVLVNICGGLFFFVTGLPLAMNGGVYIFQLGDWYFPMFGLIIGSLLEVIGIAWIYGLDRFSTDIKLMMDRDVSVVLRCMWAIVIPAMAVVLFFVGVTSYSAPDYGDGYVYQNYAIALGFCMSLCPVLGLLVMAVVTVARQEGNFMQRLRRCLRPSPKWVPNDEQAKRKYLLHPYDYPAKMTETIALNIRGNKDNPLF